MNSQGIDHDRVARALRGEVPYDDLSGTEQTLVRSAWDEGIERRIATLDFEKEFLAAGRSWADGLPDGSSIRRGTTPDD